MTLLTRRESIAALAALASASCASCARKERASSTETSRGPTAPSAPSDAPRQIAAPATASDAASPSAASASAPGVDKLTIVEWDLGARGHVVSLVPPHRAGEKLPLVIALHGRGESIKGPVRGPQGWPRDYALERAMHRIAAPPLTMTDYESLVTPERLRAVNVRLAQRPYRGLVIVCPFLPDFDWSRPPTTTVDDYAKFVVEQLLPKARAELPVLDAANATGIDGVSLGGAMGLRVGFKYAERFGAVGGLQTALNPGQVDELVQMAKLARKKNPAQALRIATSKDDAFVNSNHALSRGMTAAGITHTFEDHLGPHDYPWNRGPGSYELLLFFDEKLAHAGATADRQDAGG